jgi:hypothetical protein
MEEILDEDRTARLNRQYSSLARADAKAVAQEPGGLAHDQQHHPYSNGNLKQSKWSKSETK